MEAKALVDLLEKYALPPNWQEKIRVNDEQMEKYIKAVKFFNKIADEVGGYVDTSSCSFEVALRMHYGLL